MCRVTKRIFLLILLSFNLSNSSASRCNPNHFICNDVCHLLDLCSQTCDDLGTTSGLSHQCGCLPNFELNPDNKTCRAITTKPSWIYYSTIRTLWRIEPTNGIATLLQENLTLSYAVAADNESVYWTSGATGRQRIYGRSTVNDSTAVQTRSLNNGGVIKELAVDWWTGNIYCTVQTLNQIRVIGNVPNKFLVLISNLNTPRAIALHPSSGQMFWSTTGEKPYVGVAFMDGREQKKILETGLTHVHELAIDQPRERLYWVDYAMGKLESSTFEGLDRRLIKQQSGWSPVAVGVLDDELFTENATHLFAIDKFRGGNERAISEAFVVAVSTVHPLIQGGTYDLENPCKKYPCSYMCLLGGNGRRSCVCGEDNRLDNGTATECGQKSNSDLLIGFNDNLFLVKIEGEVVTSIVKAFPDISLGDHKIDLLASDPKTGNVFMADNDQRVILKVDPQSRKVTTIDSKGIGRISSMVFENRTNQLFFTDSLHRMVQSMNVSTTNRTHLYKFPENSVPLAIVVAPKKSQIFVAVNKSPMRIMQLSMDGKQSLYLKLNWKVDSPDVNVTLAIDEKNSMLYASLGQRVMAFDYEQGLESEAWNLSTRVNQMILRAENGKFIYSGSDGIMYWDDKNILVTDFVKGSKFSNIKSMIPIIRYVRKTIPGKSPTTRTSPSIITILLVLVLITISVVVGSFWYGKYRRNRQKSTYLLSEMANSTLEYTLADSEDYS